MIVFTVTETKQFMAKLLKGELFDTFALRQFDAETFTQFQIIGLRNHSFFAQEEENDEKYCLWSEIRPYAYLLIKGSRLPKSIKIVFSLTDAQTAEFNNAAALFLNITFYEGVVTCTTGSSQKAFTLDKSLEQGWDEYIKQFFKTNGIGIVDC